jgi:ankyrin repeat protein
MKKMLLALLLSLSVRIACNDEFLRLVHKDSTKAADVEKYIKSHSDLDINYVGSYRDTPLLDGIYSGNVAIVKVLLAYGADVNQAISFNKAPLTAAADLRDSAKSLEITRLLLNKGIKNIDKQANYSLNRTSNLIYSPYEKQATYCAPKALTNAAHRGHVEVVRLLLDHGVGVNFYNSRGITALFNAAHWGHLEIVKLLLNRGARTPFTYSESRDFFIMANTEKDSTKKANYEKIIALLFKNNILHKHYL